MSTTLADLPTMDADAFLAWELQQTDDERYELHDGRVLRMPTEGFLHGEIKAWLTARLVIAIERAEIEGQVFTSDTDVLVASGRVFKPDAVVRLGPRLPPREHLLRDPVIVFEVLSPSTSRIDVGLKLAGYFSVPSVQHYLIVDPDDRRVVHHRRTDATTFATRIHGDTAITLDPPGITIDRLFP